MSGCDRSFASVTAPHSAVGFPHLLALITSHQLQCCLLPMLLQQTHLNFMMNNSSPS